MWDILGNISKFYRDVSNSSETPSKQLNFGQAKDMADSFPKDASWLEKTRLSVMNFGKSKLGSEVISTAVGAVAGARFGGLPGAVVGAAAGSLTPPTTQLVDKKTGGKLSKALVAGQNEIRSNYAYKMELYNNDVSLAILSTFGMGLGAVGGAAAGFKAAGVRGIKSGAALGIAAESKLERSVAKTDTANKLYSGLKKAALTAESQAGQEEHNFGRDVTAFTLASASKIQGNSYTGDITKGLPAITSGILNIALEWGPYAPDMAAFSAAGAVGAKVFVNPIASRSIKTNNSILTNLQAKERANNLAEHIDLIDRTANGEKTIYTPIMDFIEKNDAATLINHPFFNQDTTRVAASLFAGQDKQTQALLFKVGAGDKDALVLLEKQAADKAVEIERYEGKYQVVSINGVPTVTFPGVSIKQREAALAAMRKKEDWLNESLQLDSRLQNRTVSKFAYLDKLRADMAENATAIKLETGITGQRRTMPGEIIQTIYQSSGLSTPIRYMNRLSDDAPHSTVDFNNVIESQDRVRTNIRAAVKKGALDPAEAQNSFNKFLNSRNETEKLDMIEKHNEVVIKGLAAKYNIAEVEAQHIVDAYNANNRTLIKNAKSAKELKAAYMVDPMNPEELLRDPQLVTQLANGSYLVDIENVDRALAKWAGENKLKRFTSKEWDKQKNIEWAAVRGKEAADYVMSHWRGLTLLRGGYPLNIIRDSSVRLWGQMQLLETLMMAGKDFLPFVGNTLNTVGKIETWQKISTRPKARVVNIRKNINSRVTTLQSLETQLAKKGYDVNNPPKNVNPDLLGDIQIHANLKANIDALRAQEANLVANLQSPKKLRDGTFEEGGMTFNDGRSGRFGQTALDEVYGGSDIRRALASAHDLAIENASRGRTGGAALTATKDEALHLQTWESILNNQLRYDEVSRRVMKGDSKADIVAWLRSSAGARTLSRMGISKKDAGVLVEQSRAMLDWYAPSQKMRDLVLADKMTILELKKLYPDINSRPVVISDVVSDNMMTSNARKDALSFIQNGVKWLSTQPTGVLLNSPYFEVLYRQKIEEMVSVAATQGRILGEKDKLHFERVAREFAVAKQKNTLNAFHRDMNYNGAVQYMIAFFPALVEQFKSYGRIAYEHPEFIVKATRIKMLPEQFAEVQVDQYGTEYVEVTVPSTGLKARLNTSWFNPVNPTGGAFLSAGPGLAIPYNELAKRVNLEGKFTDLVLPFGVQANSLNAIKPNTVKRLWELFDASQKKNSQFNKDANMLLMQKRYNFKQENHREPTNKEFLAMSESVKDDAVSLSILRFVSSLTLPTQPRYVTPISAHADILGKYINQYGMDEGSRKFAEKYPDYFLLATHLSDSTSGINPNRTTMELIKNNPKAIEKITGTIGESNLGVLGAIFRDDTGAFSKEAALYLESSSIPGTSQKFKNTADYRQANRSNIVSQGWDDWNKLITIVTEEMDAAGYSVASGYGKAVMDVYKEQFIAAQKEKNPIWYSEKTAGPDLSLSKLEDTVTTVTIALTDPKIWKVLSKQPLMHTIADYMDMRYDVNQILTESNITYNSQAGAALKEKVNIIVEDMKKKDINFGKWYERYFGNDDFSYVYQEGK